MSAPRDRAGRPQPVKLTKPVLPTMARLALSHPGGVHHPPTLIETYSLDIQRTVDGRVVVVVHHGGLNVGLVMSGDDRRALGRALLEPHPQCPTCDDVACAVSGDVGGGL